MGDDDGNNMDNMSGIKKSEVGHVSLSIEDLISVLLPTQLGLVPAVSGMVYSLVHEILLSSSFS